MAVSHKYPMSTIIAAVEYRKTHTTKETAEKYNASPTAVNNWCKIYGDGLGFIRKPRKPRPDYDAKWKPAVRILKKVPKGLEVPERGFGW